MLDKALGWMGRVEATRGKRGSRQGCKIWFLNPLPSCSIRDISTSHSTPRMLIAVFVFARTLFLVLLPANPEVIWPRGGGRAWGRLRGGMRDKNLLSCAAFFSNQGRKQELMSQGHKQDAVILTQWKRDGDPEAKEQSPSMCSPPPSSVSEHVRPLIGVTMMTVGRKRSSAIRLGQVTEQRSERLQAGD